MSYDLPYKRLIGSTLLLCSVLLVLFSGLTYYRLLALPLTVASYCESTDPSFQLCLTDITVLLLNEPQWLAVKFTVYIVTALLLQWLMFRHARGQPLANTGITGMLVSILLYASTQSTDIETIAVEPFAALTGSLLAGLFIHRAHKRRLQR